MPEECRRAASPISPRDGVIPQGLERKSRRLTHKPELVGKHVEKPIAVHGKENGKVNSQAAPDEEVVDGRPVACVQANLQKAGVSQAEGPITPTPCPLPRNTTVVPRAAPGTGGSLLPEVRAVLRLPHTCTLTTMTSEVATVTAKDW